MRDGQNAQDNLLTPATPEDDLHDSGELEFSSLRPERSDQASKQEPSMLARIGRWLLTWRRPLGAGVALLLIVAIAGDVLFSAYQQATTLPPVPLTVADRSVYFEYGASWGTLLVNGQRVDMQSLFSAVVPITLQRGTSRIDFSAPPYPPLHCVISAPPARTDTCPLLNDLSVNDPISSPDLGRVVNLGDLVSRLPSNQFNALVQATEGALATLAAKGFGGTFFSSVTLQVGDHYLDAQGNVKTATAPMKATLSFALQRSGYRQAVNDRFPCKIFCDAWPNPVEAWMIINYIYTPLDRKGSASQGSPFPPQVGGDGSFLMPLDVSWANGWRVSISQYDAMGATEQLCGMGDELATQDLPSGGAVAFQQYGVGDALGCAYTMSISSQQVQGRANLAEASDGPAIFFFRCGVMMAVNAAAQQFAPSLPMASPHETWAAQQLINGQTYSSG